MPNPDIDIVAVHGLGGHFEGTWTDSDSNKLWLRDFLPSQLEEVGMVLLYMARSLIIARHLFFKAHSIPSESAKEAYTLQGSWSDSCPTATILEPLFRKVSPMSKIKPQC